VAGGRYPRTAKGSIIAPREPGAHSSRPPQRYEPPDSPSSLCTA
jgi:hypothetical protein